jgi:hypothetical protein
MWKIPETSARSATESLLKSADFCDLLPALVAHVLLL